MDYLKSAYNYIIGNDTSNQATWKYTEGYSSRDYPDNKTSMHTFFKGMEEEMIALHSKEFIEKKLNSLKSKKVNLVDMMKDPASIKEYNKPMKLTLESQKRVISEKYLNKEINLDEFRSRLLSIEISLSQMKDMELGEDSRLLSNKLANIERKIASYEHELEIYNSDDNWVLLNEDSISERKTKEPIISDEERHKFFEDNKIVRYRSTIQDVGNLFDSMRQEVLIKQQELQDKYNENNIPEEVYKKICADLSSQLDELTEIEKLKEDI
jgi:hypothetical protein